MIQNQFINFLLDSKDSTLLTQNNLSEEFFSDYKEEYKFITDHFEKYGILPDKATFLAKFTSFDVLEVQESPKYLVDALYEDRNKRHLALAFNKVRNYYNEGKTEEAFKVFMAAAENVANASPIRGIDIFKDLSRYDSYISRMHNFSRFFVQTGFEELDELLGGWSRLNELAVFIARPGVGKCLEKGTEVMMADGSLKKVEDVVVGDSVQSINGSNTVLALHNGKSKGYRIIPKRGDEFTVSEGHTLTLMKAHLFWDKERKTSTSNKQFELVDIKVEDYLALSPYEQHKYRLWKPELYFPEADLKIPPYILGLWLGDGTSCRPELTTADDIIKDQWVKFAESFNNTARRNTSHADTRACSYEIAKGFKSPELNMVSELFKHYNLFENKHIPLEYLTASREQRLQLLAGILDTDGYYDGSTFDLCLANYELIKNVRQLATGLGFRVGKIYKRLNKKYNKVFYRISILGKLWEIPTLLPHKQAIHRPGMDRRTLNLANFRIEAVDEIEYYGFRCDGDERYLLADGTVTHNTWLLLKSAAAAAEQGLRVGLYSGEMDTESVGYRIDTIIGHISNGMIAHGNDRAQNDYKRYLESLSSQSGSLIILTPKEIGGLANVNTLRAFIENDQLDILFIDQYSLLEDIRNGRTETERTANISKDLKKLQVALQIPIIAASQQNRSEKDGDSGKATTANIAQSDRIGQDASTVIAIEQKDGILTLYLAKSRNSVSGKTFKYAIDLDKGIFNYIPAEGENGENQAQCEQLKEEFDNYIPTGEDVF